MYDVGMRQLQDEAHSATAFMRAASEGCHTSCMQGIFLLVVLVALALMSNVVEVTRVEPHLGTLSGRTGWRCAHGQTISGAQRVELDAGGRPAAAGAIG